MSYVNEDNAFVRISKEVIKSKKYDGNAWLLLTCVKYNLNMFGKWTTDINEIVRQLGGVPDRHIGAINDKTKELIKSLSESKTISTSISNFELLQHNTPFEISMADNDIFELEYDGETGKAKPYVQFTYREYVAITNAVVRYQRQKGILTDVFICMKSYMNMDNITHKFAYPPIESVAKKCGATKKVVASALDHLEELKLLYKHATGSFVPLKGKTAGVRQNAPNVYSVEPFNKFAHIEANNIMIHWVRSKSEWGLDKFGKFGEISFPEMGKRKQEIAEQKAKHEQEGYDLHNEMLSNAYPEIFGNPEADESTQDKLSSTDKSGIWGEPPPTSHVPLEVGDDDAAALDEAEPNEPPTDDIDDYLSGMDVLDKQAELRKTVRIKPPSTEVPKPPKGPYHIEDGDSKATRTVKLILRSLMISSLDQPDQDYFAELLEKTVDDDSDDSYNDLFKAFKLGEEEIDDYLEASFEQTTQKRLKVVAGIILDRYVSLGDKEMTESVLMAREIKKDKLLKNA